MFVKVCDDLGTPLVLGQTNLLAPQAYLRITQVGLEDPLGYVISVIMIVFSIAAMTGSAGVLRGRDSAPQQNGGSGLRRLRRRQLGALSRSAAAGSVPAVVVSPAPER